jgi:hypothetical protein
MLRSFFRAQKWNNITSSIKFSRQFIQCSKASCIWCSFEKHSKIPILSTAVLWIRDILVRICIRILLFLSVAFKMATKNEFLRCSAYYFLKVHLHESSKINTVDTKHKKSRFFLRFLLDDGRIPDPGGRKTYGSGSTTLLNRYALADARIQTRSIIYLLNLLRLSLFQSARGRGAAWPWTRSSRSSSTTGSTTRPSSAF